MGTEKVDVATYVRSFLAEENPKYHLGVRYDLQGAGFYIICNGEPDDVSELEWTHLFVGKQMDSYCTTSRDVEKGVISVFPENAGEYLLPAYAIDEILRKAIFRLNIGHKLWQQGKRHIKANPFSNSIH